MGGPLPTVLGTLAAAIAIPAMLAVLWAVYVYWQGPGFYYTNEPFPVQPAAVEAGDAVTVTVGRCYSGSSILEYSVDLFLLSTESANRKPLVPVSSEVDPGCSTINEDISIPPNTTPGHYVMKGTAIITWAFGIAQIPWQSQPFEVIQPTP